MYRIIIKNNNKNDFEQKLNDIQSLLNEIFENSDLKDKIRIKTYTPFQVSISESKPQHKNKRLVSLFALVGGLIGFILSVIFQHWTSFFDYNLNVGGKPFFSEISSVTFTFLISILFTAIFSFLGFLLSAGLPNWKDDGIPPELLNESLQDKFLIVLDLEDKHYEELKEKLIKNLNENFLELKVD